MNDDDKNLVRAKPIAVADKAYCLWGRDLEKENIRYLTGLDAGYFHYVGKINKAHLYCEDRVEGQRAATAIRVAYHQGLETFFALLFATLQSPWCVLGWMQVYAPGELRRIVRAVDPATVKGTEQKKQSHAHRKKIAPYTALKERHLIYWDYIAQTIYKYLDLEPEEKRRTQELFASRWSKFAADFTKDELVSEHNSIKHGFRVNLGGLVLYVGLQPASGERPDPEEMHQLTGSEHGSSFFTPRTILESYEQMGKAAKNRETHFGIKRQQVNWDAEKLCDSLDILSASINNVRDFALLACGYDRHKLQVEVPVDSSFEGASQASKKEALWSTQADIVVPGINEADYGDIDAEMRRHIARLRADLDP